MALRTLSRDECEAILKRNRLGVIAIREGEGAYAVPISYAYADNAIYAHCAPGRKLTLMRESPKVTLQVGEVQTPAYWRSVMLRGQFEELHEGAEKFRARMLLLNAFEGSAMGVTAGHGHRATLANAIFFRIVAEEITGRAEHA